MNFRQIDRPRCQNLAAVGLGILREDENELQILGNSDFHRLVVGLVDYSDSGDRKRFPRVDQKRKDHVNRLLK